MGYRHRFHDPADHMLGEAASHDLDLG
jgi:hypothetical protein